MSIRAIDDDEGDDAERQRLQAVILEEEGDEGEERMAAMLSVPLVEEEELRPVYAGLPDDVVQRCEGARQHMRQEFIQQLRRVRDALAPYGRFKEWCRAVRISYHTAQSMLWRADRERAVAQTHNRSPRKRQGTTAERQKKEWAAAPVTAWLARVAALRAPGPRFDEAAWGELYRWHMRQGDEEEVIRMDAMVARAQMQLDAHHQVVSRVERVRREVKDEVERLGE